MYQRFTHFDWYEHLALCFVLTLIDGPKTAALVGVTIEAVQIESGIWQKWDHVFDLIHDAAGIIAGVFLRNLLLSLL